MQTTPTTFEVLFGVSVPQNWEKTAGLTYLARHNIKNNSRHAHLQHSTTASSPRRRAAATLKPDHDRNRLPQDREHRRLSCVIHKARLPSKPPLLALLPLEDDVLCERPQAAGLVMGVRRKNKDMHARTHLAPMPTLRRNSTRCVLS